MYEGDLNEISKQWGRAQNGSLLSSNKASATRNGLHFIDAEQRDPMETPQQPRLLL